MAQSNRQWVTDLYKTSMGRTLDMNIPEEKEGLDYWTKQIDDRGEGRKDFISKYFHGHDDAKAFRNNPQPDPTPAEDYTGAFDFAKYGVSNPTLYGDHANLNADHNTDLIYQNIIGRNADRGGRVYWTDHIKSKGDQGYQDMVNSLLASTEYKDRESAVAANPNITEQELDRLSSAFVSPFHTYSGSAVGGWTPGDSRSDAHLNAVVSDYSDRTNKTVDDVIASNTAFNTDLLANPVDGVESRNATLGGPLGITGGVDTKVATNLETGLWDKVHDTDSSILGSGAVDFPKTLGTTNTNTVGETLTNTGAGAGVIKEVLDNGNLVLDVSNITGGANNDTVNGGANNDTVNGGANNGTVNGGADNGTVTIDGSTGEIVPESIPAGLTMDDLNSWWAGIDKSQFGGGGNNMNDFMQFMMMMNMMGGGRGGYGGSQYGYGGLNPGGVSPAFDYKDMASWMKDTFGSGSGSGTTASLNVGG